MKDNLNVEFEQKQEESYTVRSVPVEQKIISPPNGVVVLIILLFLCLMVPVLFISGATAWRGGGFRILLSILLCCILPFMFAGLRSVRPNEALVLTLFGKYYGTIVKPGYFFVNPFARYNNPAYDAQNVTELTDPADAGKASFRKGGRTGASKVKKTVSLKRATLDNGTQKVNDALGTPIIIGAVVLWHVEDPTKAVFNVENYTEFLSIQTDSTIRNLARLYPYDVFDDGLDDDTSAKTE